MHSWFYRPYPSLSRPLRSIRKLFLSDKTYQAITQLEQWHKQNRQYQYSANDILFLRDLLFAAGKGRRACAVMKLAARYFTEDLSIQLGWLVIQSQHRRSFDLLDQAVALQERCKNESQRIDCESVCARISAELGMMQSSEKWIQVVSSKASVPGETALYHLTMASLARRDWAKAVHFAYKLLARINSAEYRMLYVRSLLCQGDLSRARVELNKLDKQTGRFFSADHFAVQFHFFIGQLDQAINQLERLQDFWPDIQRDMIQHQLLQLHWFEGNLQQAQALAKDLDSELAVKILKASDPQRQLIALPVMTQGPLMCVPTTVAMCASAHGVSLRPDILFREMKGQDGTEIWRMQDYMQQQGFEVYYLHANADIAQRCLDRNVPLIGATASLFGAHVEVICGYDSTMQGFFVRDPESLAPSFVDEEYLGSAYKASGNYLIALAPAGKLDWIEAADIHQQATDLFGLMRSVAQGEINQAKQHFSAIHAQDEVGYLRDLYAEGVCLTPADFAVVMRRYADNTDLNDVVRLRAAMNSRSATFIEQWIEKYLHDNQEIHPKFALYLQVLISRTHRDYKKVLEQLQVLLADSPSTEALWAYKADAELELGLIEQARHSIEIARDLSPKSYDVRRKVRQITPYQESLEQRQQQLKHQMQDYPSIYELEEEYADLLLNGNDGRAYADALEKCIAKRPLYPWLYEKLADWYIKQSRIDLAKNILQQGRKLLDEQHIPLRRFEAEYLQIADENTNADSNGDENSEPVIVESQPCDSDFYRQVITCWYSASQLDQHQRAQVRRLFVNAEAMDQLELSWWEKNDLIAIGFCLEDALTELEEKPHHLAKVLPLQLYGNCEYAVVGFNRTLESVSLSVAAYQCLFQWQVKLLDGRKEWRYDVAFDLAYLQENTGALNEAQQRYAEIIERAPGFYPAYYRYANVLDQKGDRLQALQHYESCLSAQPGHEGSVQRMIDIYSDIGDYSNALKWCDYYKKIKPFSFSVFEQWMDYCAYVHGANRVLATIELQKKQISEDSALALKARLLEREDRFDESLQCLNQIKNISDIERHVLVTRARCVAAQKDWQQVHELCLQALEKAADDAWFIELQLIAKQQLQSPDLQQFVEQCFAKDVMTEKLAHCWLNSLLQSHNQEQGEITPSQVHQQVLALIEQKINSGSHNHYALTRYLSPYFSETTSEDYLRWLNYCAEQFPLDLVYARFRIGFYRACNDQKTACTIAEKLYQKQPQDSEVCMLYGTVLEDSNPDQAMKLLRIAYEKSGSIECLSRIGRTHHIIGEHELAADVYWQVLGKDPFNVLAMNNLAQMGKGPQQLVSYFFKAIHKGMGLDTEYFLVNTIKIAKQTRCRVPPNWLELAEARFKDLQREKGFEDEQSRLARAMYQWYIKIDQHDKARQVLLDAGIKAPLLGRFDWPRRNWIPQLSQ